METVLSTILKSFMLPNENCLTVSINLNPTDKVYFLTQQSMSFTFPIKTDSELLTKETGCSILIYNQRGGGNQSEAVLNRALTRRRNTFDEARILKQFVCKLGGSGRKYGKTPAGKRMPRRKITPVVNATSTRPNDNKLNNIVKLVEASYRSLSVQIGGKPPFLDDFDSTRPLIYLREDEPAIHVYLFCPNVTKGSGFKKWSLINRWQKDKAEFSVPFTKTFPNCPHTLSGQTLITSYWFAFG